MYFSIIKMLALIYFALIYFNNVSIWMLLTRNPDFLNTLIPGFFSLWLTYYLIENQYLPINI